MPNILNPNRFTNQIPAWRLPLMGVYLPEVNSNWEDCIESLPVDSINLFQLLQYNAPYKRAVLEFGQYAEAKSVLLVTESSKKTGKLLPALLFFDFLDDLHSFKVGLFVSKLEVKGFEKYFQPVTEGEKSSCLFMQGEVFLNVPGRYPDFKEVMELINQHPNWSCDFNIVALYNQG